MEDRAAPYVPAAGETRRDDAILPFKALARGPPRRSHRRLSHSLPERTRRLSCDGRDAKHAGCSAPSCPCS